MLIERERYGSFQIKVESLDLIVFKITFQNLSFYLEFKVNAKVWSETDCLVA